MALFKGMGRLVKKAPNMTREEIKDAIFDLMGNSLEAIVPALENILKVIGELPFLVYVCHNTFYHRYRILNKP